MSVKKDLGTIEGHLEPINHTADGIGFNNAGSGLTSDNVQDALVELAAGGGPQAFVGQKEITTAVVLPPKTYVIATGLVIRANGSITISQDSDLLLI